LNFKPLSWQLPVGSCQWTVCLLPGLLRFAFASEAESESESNGFLFIWPTKSALCYLLLRIFYPFVLIVLLLLQLLLLF